MHLALIGISTRTSYYGGLLDHHFTSSYLSPLSPLETDKIDSLQNLYISPLLTTPSEPPSQDPLNNNSIAQRRSRSSTTSDTISPYDLTSFTTDHPQRWLPQPPSSQPLATTTNSSSSPNNNHNLPDDFVLYPSQNRPDDRSTAASTTALRSASHLANARRHSHHLQHLQVQQLQQQQLRQQERQLQLHHQQLSSSPVQDPRVTKVISQSSHGFPSPASSSSSSSHNQQQQQRVQNVYAASVPSNSPQQSTRPPVPLFYHSTGNMTQTSQMHRRNMSTSSIPQEFNDMFDFDNIDAGDTTMFTPEEFNASSFTTINDPLSGQPLGTVSPKDLMGDSAPPSTSFTDLSTPSFESPGCFSQNTSPLFATDAELAPGHESWDSLFPVDDAFSNSHLDDPSLLTSLSKDGPPASPMIRNGSSPGDSPSVSRGSGRHSSVSGVSARKREKPLRPLSYDVGDPVAVKRARNTEAARKSRARKVERQDHMERRISDLEKSLEESMEREQYWKALAETK